MNEQSKTRNSMLSSFAPTGKVAEETLHAIVLGDADAIVVETKDGPRVYTLHDASEPYRELVERMPGAAIIVDADHIILYGNGGLAHMLRREGLAGNDLLGLVAPHQRELARGLLKAGAKAQSHAELALISAGGDDVEVRASAAPMSFDGQPCVALVVTALDEIEALKISAADLRESERRFQMALATSPIAVFEQDLDLRYTWIFNPKLGYKVYDVIGRRDDELMEPGSAAHLMEIKRRVIETGEPTRQEVAAAPPGGPVEIYDLSVEARRDDAGRIVGIVCAAMDITERKRGEQTLRESEQRLKLLAQASSNVTYRMSADWGEMRQLVGSGFLADTASPSRAWLMQYIPSDEQERVNAAIDEAIRSRSKFGLEHRVVRADGGVGWTFSFAVPLLDRDGEIIEWVGSANDVTARKEDELTLRKHVALTRLAAEAARMTYAEFDFKSGRMYLAENFASVMGYAPPAVPAETDLAAIAADLLSHIAPEDRTRVLAANREFRAGKLDGSVIYRVIGDDGAQRWIEGRWTAETDENGFLSRGIAAGLDVTERTRAEEALAAAKAEAERANQAKSKFLAAASHDLRQPVQSLTLLLSMIRDQVADKPKTANKVDMAASAVDSLNDLLTGILDISKLDAGVITPELTSVDAGELVGRLALEYQSRAAAIGLALRCVAKPSWVHTDPALLERIVRNLIENALRYTSKGGILVGVRRRGERVQLDVIDTGIGIPADRQAEIFEEFRQLNNPARDASRGLGLGLAIVSRLAKLLGASVEVASRLEHGTRFSVLLPFASETPAEIEAAPAADERGGRILVIEDNTALLEIYEMMLEDWGYEALCVTSGEKAIELAARERGRFDAILADHRLGYGLTGPAAAAEISRREGRSIPTLIVTGDTAKENIGEIGASGFAMLHKPVRGEDLRRTLALLLSGGDSPSIPVAVSAQSA